MPRSPAYVFMMMLAVIAPALAHADAPRAACDAVDIATVLHPAADAARDARAYWLDRRLIQWPRVASDGYAVDNRFRLYMSATAGLRAEPGHAVTGAWIGCGLVGAVLEWDYRRKHKLKLT